MDFTLIKESSVMGNRWENGVKVKMRDFLTQGCGEVFEFCIPEHCGASAINNFQERD